MSSLIAFLAREDTIHSKIGFSFFWICLIAYLAFLITDSLISSSTSVVEALTSSTLACTSFKISLIWVLSSILDWMNSSILLATCVCTRAPTSSISSFWSWSLLMKESTVQSAKSQDGLLSFSALAFIISSWVSLIALTISLLRRVLFSIVVIILVAPFSLMKVFNTAALYLLIRPVSPR